MSAVGGPNKNRRSSLVTKKNRDLSTLDIEKEISRTNINSVVPFNGNNNYDTRNNPFD